MSENYGRVIKNVVLGTQNREPAEPPDLPDLPETTLGPAGQNHPSTRAGGQDDVSLNKPPQIKENTIKQKKQA